MPTSHLIADNVSRALVAERARLVRLCRQLTGNSDAAEDLAQETLLEAWRLLDRLRDAEGLGAWLTAIARNVCHRWLRTHGRERAHLASMITAEGSDEAAHSSQEAFAAEVDDPLAQVERAEVAELVSRALATLPEATRALTIASVALSTAELANQFGFTEGNVRVRLHRGRQALRLALSGDLRAEAESLGLTLPTESVWTESRMWCPFCGASHLRYRIDRETGEYAFHCASECAGYAVAGLCVDRALVEEVSSPKSLLARHCLHLATSYREALAGAPEQCDCGAPITFTPRISDDAWHEPPFGIIGVCPNCGPVDTSSAWHLALDTVEAQRFWRRYPRMRALPMVRVERNNRPAIATGFASVDGGARLHIVSDAATYATLYVEAHGAL